MHRQVSRLPATSVEPRRQADDRVRIEGVNLLTAVVTVIAVIDASEHERRRASGSGAFTDPALLERLLGLPLGVAVSDPVVWAETAGQHPCVIGRDLDGIAVTRLLAPPLFIEDVIVAARNGRDLRAVQDASLFAGFARRWVMSPVRLVGESMLLEAKLCGVGILDASGAVVLTGEPPKSATLDGWDWMLREKAYRHWLSGT